MDQGWTTVAIIDRAKDFEKFLKGPGVTITNG